MNPESELKKCDSKHHYGCLCDCLPCKTADCKDCDLGEHRPDLKNGDMCHDACLDCCPCGKELTTAQARIDEWIYEMAYFTKEDVPTPKGVKQWIMDNLPKARGKQS